MPLLHANRRLLASLVATLALLAASSAMANPPADISYYFGTDINATLPTNKPATQATNGFLFVVSLATKQYRAIRLTPATAGSGKAFFYKADGLPADITVENFTSTDHVSYTFLSFTINASANSNVIELQFFLYGPNQQIDLGGGNGATSLPGSLSGSFQSLQFQSSSGTGLAAVDTYQLNLLLPQSKVANASHKSLDDAVTLATDYFNFINGGVAP